MANEEMRELLTGLQGDITDLKVSVGRIETRLGSGDKKFDGLPCEAHVSKLTEIDAQQRVLVNRMEMVERIVYGAAGMALIAVGGAIVALVVK